MMFAESILFYKNLEVLLQDEMQKMCLKESASCGSFSKEFTFDVILRLCCHFRSLFFLEAMLVIKGFLSYCGNCVPWMWDTHRKYNLDSVILFTFYRKINMIKGFNCKCLLWKHGQLKWHQKLESVLWPTTYFSPFTTFDYGTYFYQVQYWKTSTLSSHAFSANNFQWV